MWGWDGTSLLFGLSKADGRADDSLRWLQASVAMGEMGVSIANPDAPALDILNEILNSFGGRLFNEIRSKEVCTPLNSLWRIWGSYPTRWLESPSKACTACELKGGFRGWHILCLEASAQSQWTTQGCSWLVGRQLPLVILSQPWSMFLRCAA